MKKMIVTGSSGLIGSEVVEYFDNRDWQIYGFDNNMRADFFGANGDNRKNQARLERDCHHFNHVELDIRDRESLLGKVAEIAPDAIVHAAAQPSHDLAASRPFDDFDVNAVGTMNLLEATRRVSPDTVFVFLSTNKVYGDAPNELELIEMENRWDYQSKKYQDGIDETMRIDRSKHSLFGASKVAADVLVQEYGRYFSMPTCCLRGGCLTGPSHSGVELHGFLSYLVKANVLGINYNIFGYKGKQVRDNIHSLDVARFIEMYIKSPRAAEVYNIGGGRSNSCSILEAFKLAESITGKPMKYEYLDENRKGDHICYISDLSKAKSHYPKWDISVSLKKIFEQIAHRWMEESSQ